jgi:signal transduction histidine kinase
MANRRILGIGELGIRLAAAFVGVALAAVLVLVLLGGGFVATDVTGLVHDQQADLVQATAVAAGDAYDPGGWHRVDRQDLVEAADLVAQEGAELRLTDVSGRLVFASNGFGKYPAQPQFTSPIYFHGRKVGRVEVRFSNGGLGGAIALYNVQRTRARVISAVIAALIALGVSVVVARVITAPLDATLSAIRVRASGYRPARIWPVRGVGVLRELQEGYNEASDRMDRLERMRSDLVADVAHELRTPIAIVQAGHEAMLDGLTEPSAENLASLRDEVLRLSRMVEDLQRLSAAESAVLRLKLVPEDLAVIAADAASRMADRFDAAGLRLECRLAQAHVMCDRDRMREVITNLLTNALKFTPAGGNVLLEVGPLDQSCVRLRVTDTGVGIPPDELPRVTERFFRGEASAAMAAGSGIGLTIVAELVRGHDGELAIKSEQQQGTEVTVTLPPLMPGQLDDRKSSSRTVVMHALTQLPVAMAAIQERAPGPMIASPSCSHRQGRCRRLR